KSTNKSLCSKTAELPNPVRISTSLSKSDGNSCYMSGNIRRLGVAQCAPLTAVPKTRILVTENQSTNRSDDKRLNPSHNFLGSVKAVQPDCCSLSSYPRTARNTQILVLTVGAARTSSEPLLVNVT